MLYECYYEYYTNIMAAKHSKNNIFCFEFFELKYLVLIFKRLVFSYLELVCPDDLIPCVKSI